MIMSHAVLSLFNFRVTFPNEYRCCLRIHNGQNLDIIPTFMGGLKFYSFEAYLRFHPLNFMVYV